jgi:hypothetical protein
MQLSYDDSFPFSLSNTMNKVSNSNTFKPSEIFKRRGGNRIPVEDRQVETSIGTGPSDQRDLVPTIRRIHRFLFAASVVGGTGAILVAAFANPPYYASSAGIASTVAANSASSNLMDQTHLVAQLAAAYLLPFSFLAMAWLASRRSPWLASVGASIALLGFLPLALYVGQDSLFYDIARQGSSAQSVGLAQFWNADPIMSFYGVMFGLGTVFGPTVIGIALWRSRAIPKWAAASLTVSRLSALLFPFVPYRISAEIVLAGVVLLFIGSIPVALAVMKAPYDTSPNMPS